MGLGAAGGWGIASKTGRGTMGKLLYAAVGTMAGQLVGNKVKKYRRDHNDRDVEYYEDAQTGRECSPPRDGDGLHPQQAAQRGYREGGYGGHGGREDDRYGRRHEHEHHHGHKDRSHSRHSSHSHHSRRYDDDGY